MVETTEASDAPTRIGRLEWLGLPELGIACLEARMGWGRSSWLRVSDLAPVPRSRQRKVAFRIHPIPSDPRTFVQVETTMAAGGTGSAIRTWVVLGQRVWPVLLWLRPVRGESERGAALTLGLDTLGVRHVIDHQASHLAGVPRVVPLGELGELAREQSSEAVAVGGPRS